MAAAADVVMSLPPSSSSSSAPVGLDHFSDESECHIFYVHNPNCCFAHFEAGPGSLPKEVKARLEASFPMKGAQDPLYYGSPKMNANYDNTCDDDEPSLSTEVDDEAAMNMIDSAALRCAAAVLAPGNERDRVCEVARRMVEEADTEVELTQAEQELISSTQNKQLQQVQLLVHPIVSEIERVLCCKRDGAGEDTPSDMFTTEKRDIDGSLKTEVILTDNDIKIRAFRALGMVA